MNSRVMRARTGGSDRVQAYKRAEATRGPEQREAEIVRHLPLVQSIVDRIAATLPPNVEREDLFGAGVLGLIDAVDRFDATRENTFSTYAVLRIRGAIIDELRARDWIPRGVRNRARAYQQAVDELLAELDRPPTDAELAARLGVEESRLDEIEREAQLASQISLETPVGEDGRLEQTVASTDVDTIDPGAALDRGELREVLVDALDQLKEQDRLVLKLYYFEGLYMKEIAAVLGRTESRVCQIHSRLMAVLRGRLRNAHLL